MTSVQVDLPAYGWTPRPAQMNAWRALRKGTNPVILAWHRRMGKDEVALHNAAIKTMERVGNYWHMLPIQEQARKAIWEAVNVLPDCSTLSVYSALGANCLICSCCICTSPSRI